jgi:D-alanyl-D-alanine carboxypeptidase
LVDHRTGDVLFARNPDLELPPASTTKILTAYVALESGRLADSVTVSRYASQMQPTKIGLLPGWRMNLYDLVYAILLNSANDAAVVIAEGVAGSVERFGSLMNRTAWHMGALNSHFVNPSGLPAEGHYSTARDLTTIMRHALRLEVLEQILSTRQMTIRPTAGSQRAIALRSHNRMLADPRTSVIGKTGYTRAAKKCFVGAATQNDRRVLVAVLGSTDLWGDLRRLLDWVYDNPVDPKLRPGMPTDLDWRQAAAAKPGIPRPRAQDGSASAQGDIEEPREAKRLYGVQAAAFRSRADADRLRRKVATLGYSAVVEPITVRQRRLYRVTVQGLSSRAAALRVADKLKRTYGLAPRVVSIDA